MADETRIQVLHEEDRKATTDSFMWAFRSGEDGRCSISNNASERNMKSFVIGRKAWLFADTPSGAKASAIVYSMVEMAKENGLNINSYLNFLLKKRPSDNMSDEELEQLTTWGAAAILECSNKNTSLQLLKHFNP